MNNAVLGGQLLTVGTWGQGASCLQWVHRAGEGGQLLTVVVAVGVRVFICIRVGAIVQISGP